MDGDAGRASKAPRSSSTSPSNPAIAEERGEKDDDKNDLHKCFENCAAVGGYCDRSVGTASAYHCLLLAIANAGMLLQYSLHNLSCFLWAGEPKSRVVRLRLVAS